MAAPDKALALLPNRTNDSSPNSNDDSAAVDAATPGKRWGLFRFRAYDDEEEQDWWFASTAIPWVLSCSAKTDETTHEMIMIMIMILVLALVMVWSLTVARLPG